MLLAVALLAGLSAHAASFGYDVRADDRGYSMRIELGFSPGVTLARAVANFRDDRLIHELHSGSDPAESMPEKVSKAGLVTYQKITAFRTFGIRKAMQFECYEDPPARGGGSWHRHCDLDLTKFGADQFMDRKFDDAKCVQASALGPVQCTLTIAGRIKDYLFLKSPGLTIKAKAQALTNWGRFWYFTETGSVSAPLSNELFDRSEIAGAIAALLDDGLRAAKASPFSFAQARTFSPRVLEDHASQ